jgi:hypothetical protein
MPRVSTEQAVLKTLKESHSAPTPVELAKKVGPNPSAVSIAIQRLVETNRVEVAADWTLRLTK